MKLYQNRHFIVKGIRLGRLHIDTGRRFSGRQFLIRFDFGHGAGNRGFTFFLAINCPKIRNDYDRLPALFQAGFTRDWSNLPYVEGSDQMIIKHAFNFGRHT